MNIESVKQYQDLVKYSGDSISLVDRDGTIRYKSKSSKHVLGYEPDKLVGEQIFDLVHPDNRERAREVFEGVVTAASGTTRQVECRLRHGDGSWVWVESTLANRKDTALDGYVINTRDISERKERERALTEERERYSTVAEQSNDSIVII